MPELEKITEKIKPIAIRYNLAYVWIFGSYAKKTQKENSDVDITARNRLTIGLLYE